MRVAFKTFLAHFFDVLILNTKFEIEENMGSKISVQDIDRQAEIHAKAMEIARLEKIIDELRARLEACHEGSELEDKWAKIISKIRMFALNAIARMDGLL